MLPLITFFTGKKYNGLPSGLPAQGANLANAKLRGLDLRNESLPLADFHQADLRDCDLTNANLKQAYFVKADLSGANLSGAILDRSNFRGANLLRVKLDGAILKHAKYDQYTQLPFSKEEADKRGMDFDCEPTNIG